MCSISPPEMVSRTWLHRSKSAAPAIRYGFLLAAGFATFYAYLWQVIVPRAARTTAFGVFRGILAGSAVSPDAYRILAPGLMEIIRIPMAAVLSPMRAFVLAHALFCLAAIEFSVLVLFVLLRLWFDELASALGILLFCLMGAVAGRDHFFMPWSLLEVGLYASAVVLAVKRRFGVAALLAAIAALNRETGVFVPVLFFAGQSGRWTDRKRLAWLGVHGAIWLVVFCSLRLALGLKPHPFDVQVCLRDNLTVVGLARTLAAASAFCVAIAPAVLGYFRAPEVVRRTTLVLPLYILTILPYSMWWEVRLLLPVACIWLPLAVAGIQGAVAPSNRIEIDPGCRTLPP